MKDIMGIKMRTKMTDEERKKRHAEAFKKWWAKQSDEYKLNRKLKRGDYFKNYIKTRYHDDNDYQLSIRHKLTKACCRAGEEHLIENYELAKADNFKGWMLHHRLECNLDGSYAHSAEELKRLGMYYNRPYYELIYLTNAEHSKLHYHSGHSLPNKSRKVKIDKEFRE
jgi:hypothetical protein